MSDTPRTDKAIRGRIIDSYGRIEWVEIDFARELERENAALQVLVKELERKLAAEAEYAAETHARHQGLVEQIAKLNSENATLSEDVVKANGLLDMQMKELAKLREDKERLDWLEGFLQMGGSSVFSSPTHEAHKDLPDDTDETRWNHPFHIGYDVEIEHRGCYKWRELANGSRSIRSAIDAARAALRKEAQP